MNFTRLSSLALAATAAFLSASLTGCPRPDHRISLSKNSLHIEKGDIATLTVSSTDTKDVFSWISDHPEIASITLAGDRAATIYGENEGAAEITVTGSHSGLSEVAAVTVTPAPEGEGEGNPANEGEGEGAGEGEGEGEGTPYSSHVGLLTDYAGSATCMACHSDVADPGLGHEDEDVHESVHYQWNGPTPELANSEGEGRGVFTGFDDFDMIASINFSGLWTNQAEQPVDGGCVRCHVGLGAWPSVEPSPDQLANIDCLMCHASQYERKLVDTDPAPGMVAPRFVPDTAAMAVSMAQLDIDVPVIGGCLRCHAYAGGGPNLKRGDMDPELVDTTPDLDVHLASKAKGGEGLVCSDCHTVRNHHIAGRGADLSPTDLSDPVNCINCHPAEPHADAQINRHTNRVNCTVCHIPEFARGANGTDMHRNFSVLALNADTGLYGPFIARHARDEVPKYRFWDRQSYVLGFNEPLRFTPNNKVIIAEPLGDVADSAAQLYPFKVHTAYMPKLGDDSSMIGMKLEVLAQHGAKDNTGALVMWKMDATDREVIDAAIEAGVIESGLSTRWETAGTVWTETERWMGIFHGVAPKADALACDDCHGASAVRLDFDALGYAPKQAPELLCATVACHPLRTGDFMTVHTQANHQAAGCSVCHTFTRSGK